MASLKTKFLLHEQKKHGRAWPMLINSMREFLSTKNKIKTFNILVCLSYVAILVALLHREKLYSELHASHRDISLCISRLLGNGDNIAIYDVSNKILPNICRGNEYPSPMATISGTSRPIYPDCERLYQYD